MSLQRTHLLPSLLATAAFLALAACNTVVAPDYGVREGRFAPCPENRDCVSSQEQDPKLHIDALAYDSDRDKAHDDLITAINAAGTARIASNHRNYVRVEYPAAVKEQRKSSSFYQPENAVDEVEFYLAPGSHFIDVRSVGKLGLLESGGTRDRIERIRAIFSKLQQTTK